MEYTFNDFHDSPALSESSNFSTEFPQDPLKEHEPPLFQDPLEKNSLDSFSSSLPKKNLFITKKRKTSFITHKQKDSKPLKKSIDNPCSSGRWTRQERIKFAFALYKYGTNWIKIKEFISSRNMIQLRSHGQKFLEKLKKNKYIIEKGLDFKNYNWKESVDYLKNNLTEEDYWNVLYSIESELGDNNRMTEKYLERKRLKSKVKLNTNEESINSSSSTLEESNINYCGNKISEENDNENESYHFHDIFNLKEENHIKNDLYNNLNIRPFYNIFRKVQSPIDEISFGPEDGLEYKTKLNSLEHLLVL